ncbi:MAG: NADH-quinone oxidoreductase subunit H [Candidatus Marsarchaeota archaeon]|nr:NADH-quinone oxidoreductase subunit H [Candidatus Marsarchaeota archaeon]
MRIDKIMKLGWNWLLPLSVLNLLITFVLFIK